jgi:hypothetical protein
LPLNADGGSLENSSQAKCIDLYGLIVPMTDGVRAYFLTSLVLVPRKSSVPPAYRTLKNSSYPTMGSTTTGLTGRVMATEAASSHS